MPRYFSAIEVFVVQRFVGRIAPELLAHALVQAFGERFGQTIGERLEQDRRVIVVLALEFLQACVSMPMPAVTAKPPIQSRDAGCFRRDEIGEAEIGPPGRLVDLLAQEVQRGDASAPLPRGRGVGVGASSEHRARLLPP